MADFKETLSICEHNGILGHQTRFWDYIIIQEDLADGKTKVIRWDIALDAEHISKILMDWAETLEEGRKLVAKFCKFDFCKSQYLKFKTEY
jgi:hypothetical protein